MLKGIQTAVAVLILTCITGGSTVHAQVSSKQLTSLNVLQTSCNTSPEEFLYALRFGQKLGDTTSKKDSKFGVGVVFASSNDKKSHFQTEITAKEDDGSTLFLTSAKVIPEIEMIEEVEAEAVEINPEQVVNSGLDPEVLFQMANQYRAGLGLAAFEKDVRVCEIASARRPQLNAEVANGNMHAGLHNANYPFWVTENMISMRSNQEAFQWWLNSPVHRGQLQGDFKYACAACEGNACALVFTNFISK